MNYKKLLLGITITNLLAWVMLEIWRHIYSGTVVQIGAGLLAAVQVLAYYIIIIDANKHKTPEKVEITPANCNHDWQPHQYGRNSEQCIICKAERGKI